MPKNKFPWETNELDINAVNLSGTLQTHPALGEWKIPKQDKTIFMCKFDLSVQDRNDRKNYVEVVTFGRCAYYCARALRKSDRVSLSGRLRQVFHHQRLSGAFNHVYIIARLVTPLYIDPKIIESRLLETEKYNVLKDEVAFATALKLGIDKVLPESLRCLYMRDGKFFSRTGLWGELYWYLYKIMQLFD
jgi:hypothetical protein